MSYSECAEFSFPEFDKYIYCGANWLKEKGFTSRESPGGPLDYGEPSYLNLDSTSVDYGETYAVWALPVNWPLIMLIIWGIGFTIPVFYLLLDRLVQTILVYKIGGKKPLNVNVLNFVVILHHATLTTFCMTKLTHRIHFWNTKNYNGPVAGTDMSDRAEKWMFFTCVPVLYVKQRMINTMPGKPESILSTILIQITIFLCFPY